MRGYHDHHHGTKNLKIAFFLNIGFTIVELIGGVLVNSVAIMSDAVHDLGDSFSLGMAWFLENKSKQKPDSKYTFGYHRFSPYHHSGWGRRWTLSIWASTRLNNCL